MRRFTLGVTGLLLLLVSSGWGFFGHRQINQMAVFALPTEMISFYKKNLAYIEEAAVNPDRRRYAVPEEGPRHYIDIDTWGDSAFSILPKRWPDAVARFGADSLQAHGILPWHIATMYRQLTTAFILRDPDQILKLSTELGHYVSDAHVPLHTSSNHDGQLTGQDGIHGFWESRLPELFNKKYTYYVGRAQYIGDVQATAWMIVANSAAKRDSVLDIEKKLAQQQGGRKYSFETRGRQVVRVIDASYASRYHALLNGMVERQLVASIRMTANLWFSAWVDAGQPDLRSLLDHKPSEEELKRRAEELQQWRSKNIKARTHESEQ